MTSTSRKIWVTIFIAEGLLNFYVLGSIILHDATGGSYKNLLDLVNKILK